MESMTLLKDAFQMANVLLIPILMYLHKIDNRMTVIETIQQMQLPRRTLKTRITDTPED